MKILYFSLEIVGYCTNCNTTSIRAIIKTPKNSKGIFRCTNCKKKYKYDLKIEDDKN